MCRQALTHSQTTDFKLFQTERVCKRLFKFHKNGGKLSRQVENTVGKREIARYEQFLLFPRCFHKTCTVDTLKPGLVWERFNAAMKNVDQCQHAVRDRNLSLSVNFLHSK